MAEAQSLKPQAGDEFITAENLAFCKRLPKIELHAHLAGSVSPETLQEIWEERRREDPDFPLDPPVERLRDGAGQGIESFFPLFTTYTHHLLSTTAGLRHATRSILASFAADGVIHLELRTGPRAFPGHTHEDYVFTAASEVALWNQRAEEAEAEAKVEAEEHDDAKPQQQKQQMRAYLILSVDRGRDSAADAERVVRLAAKYKLPSDAGTDVKPNVNSGSSHDPRSGGSLSTAGGAAQTSTAATTTNTDTDRGAESLPRVVVGVDLGGNSRRGDVNTYTPAFQLARSLGLSVVVHFGETPAPAPAPATVAPSPSQSPPALDTPHPPTELETLLSWLPKRLGHAIHVPADIRSLPYMNPRATTTTTTTTTTSDDANVSNISNNTGTTTTAPIIEACLSCNVLSGLTPPEAGFSGHPARGWIEGGWKVAFCTDDVGVFGSPASREWAIGMGAFGLGRGDVVGMVGRLVGGIEGGVRERGRVERVLRWFAEGEGLDLDAGGGE